LTVNSCSRGRRARLVVLQTHPIQYYAPLYRALAERARVEVKVVYLSDVGVGPHDDPGFGRQVAWDIPLLEGYEFRILQPGKAIAGSGFWDRRDSRLAQILAAERPDWLLLYGYASLMNWQALVWARKHGVRVAYQSDSNARLMRRGWQVLSKQMALRWFFNRIEAFLSPGEANFDYLRFFGVEPDKIVWCPFAIDVLRFQSAMASGNEGSVEFVWASKMIPHKRPLDFLRAVEELWQRGHVDVKAALIGSGPQLETVRRAAESLVARGAVEFRGFINQSEMPAELSRGRIFVFTSERDPFGLAATEAAACGMALIVADINGCVGDHASARPGVNALTYPAGNIKALAYCMETLLTNPAQLRLLREASLAVAAEHDVGRAAAIIESVVDEGQAQHA
jgi:glycosyltransferase involved in cell wall biosynthesis